MRIASPAPSTASWPAANGTPSAIEPRPLKAYTSALNGLRPRQLELTTGRDRRVDQRDRCVRDAGPGMAGDVAGDDPDKAPPSGDDSSVTFSLRMSW